MIKGLLKNIVLITFALIAPVTLPAGGIQKNFNENKFTKNPEEITLSSACPLYKFPNNNAKKLFIINSGTSLSILRMWKLNQSNIWIRVELSKNFLMDNPNKITKGWIKM